MNEFDLVVASFLLLTVGLGLLRVLRGPTAADRMLAVQLLGTNSIAIALLLREAGLVGADDVALVLAMLSVLAMAALVRRRWPGGEER